MIKKFSATLEILDNRSDCKCVSLSSRKSVLHKQPSMTACFSHYQCPSIRSNDRLREFNSMNLTEAYLAENILSHLVYALYLEFTVRKQLSAIILSIGFFAYNICCILFSDSLQASFIVEAITMNPDQTAPMGEV